MREGAGRMIGVYGLVNEEALNRFATMPIESVKLDATCSSKREGRNAFFIAFVGMTKCQIGASTRIFLRESRIQDFDGKIEIPEPASRFAVPVRKHTFRITLL